MKSARNASDDDTHAGGVHPEVRQPMSGNGMLTLAGRIRNPYFRRAAMDELARLLAATEGERNDTLNKVAFNIGTIVGGGHWDEMSARDELLQRALAVGLPEREALATIDSGFKAGLLQPRKALPRNVLPQTDNGTDQAGEDLPQIFMPGGAQHVTTLACARALGQLLSEWNLLFRRNGKLVQVEPGPLDRPQLAMVSAATLPSLFESVARLYKTVRSRETDEIMEVPTNCGKTTAEVLAASAEFLRELPAIELLANCPVLTEHGGELITITGYHRATGIYVAGGRAEDVLLDEAVALLLDLLGEFNFAKPGDLARAVAALITPALIQGNLLGGRAPIDLGEADQSQSGKGFRNKLTAAIHNDVPRTVTRRERGTGGLEESFASAVIRGASFIAVDNARDKLDSPELESALTEDVYSARAPYKDSLEISLKRTTIMLTSNKAELTRDLANRASPVSIRKQAPGHQYKVYPEGDLLAHVRAHQGRYLGAVFAVIRAWYGAGRPRTNETRHDFRAWAQTLDWIVQTIFGLAPLCDGLSETRERMSNPALNWVRDVALSVEQAGELGLWLRAADIVEILDAQGNDLPGLPEGGSLGNAENSQQVLRAVGKEMKKAFTTARVEAGADTACLRLESYLIERQTQYDTVSRNETKRYRFSREAKAGQSASMLRPSASMGASIQPRAASIASITSHHLPSRDADGLAGGGEWSGKSNDPHGRMDADGRTLAGMDAEMAGTGGEGELTQDEFEGF